MEGWSEMCLFLDKVATLAIFQHFSIKIGVCWKRYLHTQTGMVWSHWKRRKAGLKRWRVNTRKLSKYMNTRDAESDQVPLELVTIIRHRAEDTSGYKSSCWLYSVCCRCVDRYSSNQQQSQAQPHQAPLKQKAHKQSPIITALLHLPCSRISKILQVEMSKNRIMWSTQTL